MQTRPEPGSMLAHYRIERSIGAGASADVFAAWDIHRRRTVALKLLRSVEPGRTRALKSEFRRLHEISHPGFVRTYELVELGTHWFFTMELVRGRSIVAGTVTTTYEAHPESASLGPRSRLPVRETFAQLAAALAALHEHGIVHLDVHPGNVLVEDHGGRVVLLDFGLARARDERGLARRGAPGFAAPELVAGAGATPAADWYSFGALLAIASGEGLGTQLSELARKLQAADPRERPTGADVLYELGATSARAEAPADAASLHPAALTRARAALARADRGRTVLLRIVGQAGAGKSHLARQIADARAGATLLRGRFRASERSALQAIDEIGEALATLDLPLGSLPDAERRALSRMLGGMGDGSEPSDAGPEGARFAARGFARAIELAAARTRVLLVLDDAHRAGEDAVRVIREIWDHAIPGLAIVLTMRPRGSGPGWDTLGSLSSSGGRLLEEIELGPASPAALADLLSRASPTMPRERADRAARAADGSPLVAIELAAAEDASSLEQAVASRVSSLRRPDADLARLVALAGTLARPIAFDAAGLDPDDALVERLERSRLVVARGVGEAERLEPPHDAIREAIVATFAPGERQRAHEAIARALMRADADPVARAKHLLSAGLREEGAREALAAADGAEQALAYDSAAELRRLALDAGPQIDRRALESALARALSAGGRGPDAARVYESLARTAGDAAERRALEVAAATHDLGAGQLGPGIARARVVVAELGGTWPRSALTAALGAIWALARFALGGASRTAEGRAAAAARADLAFGLGRSLLAVDSVRGAHFAIRSLHDGARSGDARRLARSLLVTGAAVLGALDGPLGRWGRVMIERGREIADRSSDRYLSGLAAVAECQASIYRGEWRAAARLGEEGVELLRGSTTGVAWELCIGAMGIIRALEELGDFVAARARARELEADSIQHGARYGVLTAILYSAFHDLADGDPDAVRRATDAVEGWAGGTYTVQHFYVDRLRAHAALFGGDSSRALAIERDASAALRRSGLGAVPVVAIDAAILGARVQLAARRPDLAKRPIVSLRRQARPDAAAHAAALEGCVFAMEGDEASSIRSLRLAVRLFAAREMQLAASSAAARLAQIEGGDAHDHADDMLQRGVSRPQAWLDVTMPIGRR